MIMSEQVRKIIPSKLEIGFEKIVQKLFAPLVPEKTTPNEITTLGGLFGLLGIVSAALYGCSVYFLVGTIMGVLGHLICDDLDGYVAKQRNMKSNAGAYYDLITDIMHITLLIIVFSLSGVISWRVGIILVPVYALIMFTSMNEIHYLKIFRFPTVGPFEAHMFLIALCLVAMTFTNPLIWGLTGADFIAILGGSLMCFEMFRLQIKLFKDLKEQDKE